MRDSFETTIAGADFSANGARYFRGNPWPRLPVGGVSSIHAAGFLGSGWALPDGSDWTGNGYDAVLVGSPTVAAKKSTGSVSNGYQLPFSATDLRDAGAVHNFTFSGAISTTTLTSDKPLWRGARITGTGVTANTYVVDVIDYNAGTYTVNNSQTVSTTTMTAAGGTSFTYVALAQTSTTTTTQGMLIGAYNQTGRITLGYASGKLASTFGLTSGGWAAEISNDSTRGTGLRMFSGTYTPTHGRTRYQGTGVTTKNASASVPSSALPSNASPIRLLAHYAATYTDTSDMVGWACFNRGLFDFELDAIQTTLVPWLSDRGVTL